MGGGPCDIADADRDEGEALTRRRKHRKSRRSPSRRCRGCSTREFTPSAAEVVAAVEVHFRAVSAFTWRFEEAKIELLGRVGVAFGRIDDGLRAS